MFWGIEERKYFISVDAASLNAKLTVNKDGRIEGLIDVLTIEKDPDEFHKFYNKHRNEIIKCYFVFNACSLDESAKSFHIALKKKMNGPVDINTIADLEELVFRSPNICLKFSKIEIFHFLLITVIFMDNNNFLLYIILIITLPFRK